MHLQKALKQSNRRLAIRTDKEIFGRPERTFICDLFQRAIILQLREPAREARPEEFEGFSDWKPLND